jgi:tetratricopeptide (TPR) repeat protein
MWGAVLLCVLQGATLDAERLWREGRREAAVDALAVELRSREGDAALRRRLVEAEIAIHRYDAALAHAERLGSEADALRGVALYRLGRFEDALGKLARGEVEAAWMRVDACEALARFDQAGQELAHVRKLAGEADPRLWTTLGRAAVRAGELPGAERHFRRALELDAVDAAALFGLGQVLAKLGKRDEALRYLAEHRRVTPLHDQLEFARRAVDLSPMHAANHASVGDAQRALGRVEPALAAYELASKLAQPDELAPIALRHARALVEDRQQLDESLCVLERAFERCRDVRLVVRAGDLLLEAGRKTEAAQRFESALALRPNDAEIARRLRAAQGGG